MKTFDIVIITIRLIIAIATFIILIPLLFGHKQNMLEFKAIEANIDSISAEIDKHTAQMELDLDTMRMHRAEELKGLEEVKRDYEKVFPKQ